jgi:glycerophosphoryl diester phosphodiesterase
MAGESRGWPLVLGHRGASAEVPENTLPAFERALDLGAEGVELDVRMSADCVPVVIHDDTVDRTTDGRGVVRSFTASQLAALDAGAGAGVPLLEEIAAWAASRDCWLNVELKERGTESATVGVLRRAGLRERILISSFDSAVVAEVGRAGPEFTRYLLAERWDAAMARARIACGASGVCLGVDGATPAALRALAAESIPVVVWTADEPERIRELLEAGVSAIISNVPAVAVRSRVAARSRTE